MIRIIHLSLSVENPLRAANILAQLTNGRVEEFKARGLDGAYVCMWGSDNDELVEFLPHSYYMKPSNQGAEFEKSTYPQKSNPTHMQLEVTTSIEHIKLVADRNKLHHHFRQRSGGPLYEVWIEKDFLVELVSNEIRQYSGL